MTWGMWSILPTICVSTSHPPPRPLDGSVGLARGMIPPRLFGTRPTCLAVTSIFGSLTWRRLCRNLIQYIFTFRFLSLFNPYSLTSGFYSPSSSVISILLWAQLTAAPLLHQSLPSGLVQNLVSRNSWSPTGRLFLYFCTCQDKLCCYPILLGGFHSNNFVLITDSSGYLCCFCCPYFSPELAVRTFKAALSVVCYNQQFVSSG